MSIIGALFICCSTPDGPLVQAPAPETQAVDQANNSGRLVEATALETQAVDKANNSGRLVQAPDESISFDTEFRPTQSDQNQLPLHMERCMREKLTDSVFEEIFVFQTRGETQRERVSMESCYTGHGSGELGDQSVSRPSPNNPARAPVDAGQFQDMGRDQENVPANIGELQREQRPQENHAGGTGQHGASWFQREVKLCYIAGLGSTVFQDLIIDKRRVPNKEETSIIAACQSQSGSGNDMPVFDLSMNYQATLFPRNYPETVVGSSGQAWFELMHLLADDDEVDRLRAAGTNTIRTTVLYDIDKNGEPVIQKSKEAANLIIRARVRGLAVHLTIDTFTYDVPCDGTHSENLTNYNYMQTKAGIALAKFAEELNVEYISPANEHEGGFQGSCLAPEFSKTSGRESFQQMIDPKGEPALSARARESASWYTKVLPQIREAFSGQVFADFGTIHPDVKVPGYDGLIFTLDHAHLPENKFRTHVDVDYDSATEAARSSGGVKWYVSAYLPYSGVQEFTDPSHPDYDPNYVADKDEDARMRNMQELYVEISVVEFKRRQSRLQPSGSTPGGYVLTGWVDKGVEIKGSKSEKVLVSNFG